jgi:hypothetical protein
MILVLACGACVDSLVIGSNSFAGFIRKLKNMREDHKPVL